jgi:hypothetical protein
MAQTPIQSVVNALRGCGVQGINWGDQASPYYEEVAEPQPAFPYVVLVFEESDVTHTQQSGSEGGGYVEHFPVTIKVYGGPTSALGRGVEQLASPQIRNSVLWTMDRYADHPEQLSGDNFDVIQFTRSSYSLNLETVERQPDGYSRVYVAVGKYDLWISFNYPVA